jgi:hypothetical protein
MKITEIITEAEERGFNTGVLDDPNFDMTMNLSKRRRNDLESKLAGADKYKLALSLIDQYNKLLARIRNKHGDLDVGKYADVNPYEFIKNMRTLKYPDDAQKLNNVIEKLEKSIDILTKHNEYKNAVWGKK